jgi:hypothetical protein
MAGPAARALSDSNSKSSFNAHKNALFQSVTFQGSQVKEDLTEVVFLFVDKSVCMNFNSCQVDFNRIVISQGLDSIR